MFFRKRVLGRFCPQSASRVRRSATLYGLLLAVFGAALLGALALHERVSLFSVLWLRGLNDRLWLGRVVRGRIPNP